jgi:hypothetical protein
MDTTNPSEVVKRMGVIEDGMFGLEAPLAKASGEVERLEAILDARRADLMEDAEGSAEADRKAWVERQLIHDEQDVQTLDEEQGPINKLEQWIHWKSELRRLRSEYETKAKRLSACQSMLKQFQHDTAPAGYGQGSRNV